MRILVLTNLYPPRVLGGYELGCAQVVDELRRRGHDVRVLTSRYSVTDDQPGVAGRLQLQPIYMWDLVRWMPESARRQLFISGKIANQHNMEIFLQELKEFEPDVVYFWNVLGLGGLAMIAGVEMLGVPWVMHLMDVTPIGLCTADAEPIQTLMALWTSVFASGRYISLSRQLVREIAHLGIELENVSYIPNWVIAADYQHDRFADPSARPLWSVRDKGKRPIEIVFSGVISEAKGAHIVLDVVEALIKAGVDVRVKMLGRQEWEEFGAELHRRSLRPVIHAPGAVTRHEVLEALGEADIFLFPTWEREPFGFSIIEAAAAGCPPLFTDRCGAGEYLVAGVHGLKSPRTAADFADVLLRIWNGEIDLEPIGRAGQNHVRHDMDIRSVGREIEDVLGSVQRSMLLDPALLHRARQLCAYVEQVIVPAACY